MSPTPQVAGPNVRSVTLNRNGSVSFTLNPGSSSSTSTSTPQSNSAFTGGQNYQADLQRLNDLEAKVSSLNGKKNKDKGGLLDYIRSEKSKLASSMANTLNQITSNPWQALTSMLGFGNNNPVAQNNNGFNLGNLLSNAFGMANPFAGAMQAFGNLGNLNGGQMFGNLFNPVQNFAQTCSNGLGNMWNGFGNTISAWNPFNSGYQAPSIGNNAGLGGLLRNGLAMVGLGFLSNMFNRG